MWWSDTATGGLLSPELERIGRRVVRLGVLVTWVGVVGIVPVSLLAADVQSLPVFVGCVLLLAALNLVVGGHDWGRSIREGTAPVRAEIWALVLVTVVTANLAVAIPRPGSWLYFLVIAAYFALLLPPPRAARLVVLSLAAAIGVGLSAGASSAVMATSGLGIALVSLLGAGTADMIGRVVTVSERRAQLLAVVAASAQTVTSLDPEEVPERVVDAVMQLGFDVAVVSERNGDEHGVTVERSRLGPVFDPGPLPMGPMVRQAVATREVQVREHYLSGARPNPQLHAHGVDAVVVAPVVVDQEVVALLVGGLRTATIDRSRVEAFRLLGGMLSHSLANARRFERERAAVATLDELGRLKDDFLSNVSHELRTPITVILGGLQTLQQHEEQLDPATRRDLMRRAVANAESLQSTLGALLEFARIERGGVGTRLQVVDLAQLTHRSLDRLSSMLAEHHVAVHTDGAAPVRAAVDQLDRVIDNLLLNAARHTPPGTHVDVYVQVRDHLVRVEVVDDGPGVAPEDLPHVTDRFFRGGPGNTRQSRGLGLGLALAQTILEAHGSGLEIWSAPEAGSRFAFQLPRARSRG